MSGGSYNYAYLNVNQFIDALKIKDSTYRAEFKQLLLKVSEAMQAIEYVDSGEYSYGDEIKPIIDCFRQGYDYFEELTKKDKHDLIAEIFYAETGMIAQPDNQVLKTVFKFLCDQLYREHNKSYRTIPKKVINEILAEREK